MILNYFLPMSTYTLRAGLRDLKKNPRQLLKEGIIPAVVYGPGFATKTIQIEEKEFSKVFKDAGTSQVIQIDLQGTPVPTLIHDMQRNSLSERIVHLDFYHITKGHEVQARIALRFVGASSGVKDKGGTLVTNVHEIEIQGLPEKLPASIEVDISFLEEFGDEILLKDIALPEGVKVRAAAELVVASLLAPARQEEVVAQTPAPEALTPETQAGQTTSLPEQAQ